MEAPDACPHCRASGDWIDQLLAVDFALRRFLQWSKEEVIDRPRFQAIVAHYRQRRLELIAAAQQGQAPAATGPGGRWQCWGCRAGAAPHQSHCADCGLPLEGPQVRSLRFLGYLGREVKAHHSAGRLTLAQAHACQAWSQGRWATLRSQLEKDRAPVVEAVGPAASAPAAQPRPPELRRTLLEIILDPRSIQWLLACGGALAVVGLVIWLATLGLFNNPHLIAGVLALGNLGLLLAGWVVMTATRYQLAGRALTLLACLVMPLNLWFYHAHPELVLLNRALWLPALVCCGFYAASALLLRDPLFVYVLMGGVVLTGLLMLADGGYLDTVVAPALLLVALGLLALHAERVFPPGDGPFTRPQFGRAFFLAGHAVLAGGLLVLFTGQFVGWFHGAFFRHFGVPEPALAGHWPSQLLALALILAGTYGYLYSHLVNRLGSLWLYPAALTLLWAEVTLIDVLDLAATPERIIIALALTALLVNVADALVGKGGALSVAVMPLSLLLVGLALWIGLFLAWRAIGLRDLWPYDPTWTYVGALAATAAVCRLSAHLYRLTLPWLSVIYLFATAAGTLIAAAGLLVMLGVLSWARQAPLLMLIPIAYLLAARAYRGTASERPVAWAAHAATAGMILASLLAALEVLALYGPGQQASLLLAVFCLEAALFYLLAGLLRGEEYSVYLATVLASGALWQFLAYAGLPEELYPLAFALGGLLLLVGYRLAVLERVEQGQFSGAAFQCAGALLTLGFVAGGMQALLRLLLADTSWRLAGLLAVLLAVDLLAALLMHHHLWRRWFVVIAVAQTVLTAFVVLQLLSHLDAWQRLELVSVLLGLVLLIASHVGWYREQERQSDLVTLGLLLGSLLAGVPLLIAVLIQRGQGHFAIVDEVGLLLLGVLLLSTGFVFQLKATTLTGAGLLVLYLVTLVLYVNVLAQVQLAGVLLVLGGGSIFVVGLVLSVCRDRLKALPDRIKRREGLFRVLGWR